MTAILWQRIEGAMIFVIMIAAYLMIYRANLAWAIPMLFVPDLFMLGYASGPRVGATLYNIAHLYSTGAVIIMLGAATTNEALIQLGILWIAHAGMDRMLGYGLKEPDGFKDTHLGQIGKNSD